MSEIYQIQEAEDTILIVSEVADSSVLVVNEPPPPAIFIATERNGIDGEDGSPGDKYKSLVYNTFAGETNYIDTNVQMAVDTGLAWSVGQRARLSKVVGIGIQYIEGFVTSYRDIVGTMTLSVRCDNQTTGIYEYTGGTCYVNLIGEVGASGAPGAAGNDAVADEILIAYLKCK